ncbi:MAG: ABC transporter permease subunit [Candidatus Thorarchaeota archaeon]|jgi:ABC-type transport system involved in multi-copper enzyme maturation permease subunit
MVLSKSMIVAKADLRMAMKVRFVKYGIMALPALGPIMGIAMIGLPALLDPSIFDVLIPIMVPIMSTMLAGLSIVPAAMLAANSFVGEREQNTLEPILCTPLSDNELLLGKTLSAFIPSMAILAGATIATSVGSNIFVVMAGRAPILIPDIPGLFLIGVVAPLMNLAVVSVMVIISGRVSRVYEAYQMVSVLVIIMFIPMFGSFTGIESGVPDPNAAWFANFVTFLIVLALMGVTLALAWTRFNRDKLVSLV